MSAKDQYRELTLRLLENEAWGTLLEEQEDAIRDQMDELWWAMTQQERVEADEWLAAQRAKAPDTLGLVEVHDAEAGPIHREPEAA